MMRLSPKFFPPGLQEQAAWFFNFASQFELLAILLGFTVGRSLEVNTDNEAMQKSREGWDGYPAAVKPPACCSVP